MVSQFSKQSLSKCNKSVENGRTENGVTKEKRDMVNKKMRVAAMLASWMEWIEFC